MDLGAGGGDGEGAPATQHQYTALVGVSGLNETKSDSTTAQTTQVKKSAGGLAVRNDFFLSGIDVAAVHSPHTRHQASVMGLTSLGITQS